MVLAVEAQGGSTEKIAQCRPERFSAAVPKLTNVSIKKVKPRKRQKNDWQKNEAPQRVVEGRSATNPTEQVIPK
jgi:hypothetical protein